MKNIGNVASQSVPIVSGIAPSSGSWVNVMGLFKKNTGSIAPGATKTFSVSNYKIGCGAFTQVQWIKAEVNYADGGFDNCNPGNNNFHQEPISILPGFGFCP